MTVEVPASLGSSGGIKAVLAGALDIALTSRPLTEAERRRGARERAYAKTALVLATATAAVPADLSTRMIEDIYLGRTTAWPDGTTVRIIIRPENDSDSIALKAHFPAISAALTNLERTPGIPIAFTDQDAAGQIEEIPGAIGPISLSVILGEQRRLTPLAINRVLPSLHTIADGSYPLVKTLYFVTPTAPTPLAGEFMAFAGSVKGRGILRGSGLIDVDTQPAP